MDVFGFSNEVFGLIILLAILEFGLLIIALFDFFKKENREIPNRTIWLIVIIIAIIGPIIYFWMAPRTSSSRLEFDDDTGV